MPGIGQDQSKEGAVSIPVTTGESSDSPITSTVPERDAATEEAPFQDIRPPAQESGKTVQVQVQGEVAGDANLQEAIGNLDKIANQPAPTGLEFKEENAGQPVNIVGDPTREAVDQSLQGNNPHELEALVSADTEDGQVVEPAAVEIAQPVAEPKPQVIQPPADSVAEPEPALAPEPAPIIEPGLSQPETPAEPIKLADIPPDQAPVVGEPRVISRAEENRGIETYLANMEEYRRQRDLVLDRQKQLADQIRSETDRDKQRELELELRKVTREIDGWNDELNILSSNMAFYIHNRVGSTQQEQGPASGGAK